MVVAARAKLVQRKPELDEKNLDNGCQTLTSTIPVIRAFILPHRVEGASSIF